MALRLLRVRRRYSSRWVCQSCRGIRTTAPLKAPVKGGLRGQGPARTRFAPSPTGFLHLGSLRTALYNYMIAKATGGQFVLRVEDTDQKRTIPGAEDALFRDLDWAGLEWDEGPRVGGPYGPYRQSERTAIYKEHAERLVNSGNAYRCFCTFDRLQKVVAAQHSAGIRSSYDGRCRHVSKEESDDRAAKGESHAIRLLSPNRAPEYDDLVHGRVRPMTRTLSVERSIDDPILLKSDGYPTYHLANVIDDHLMRITHVIRGTEWTSSTPMHVMIYQAFGWTPPKFGHVSLLVDKDGAKLSKRFEAMNISEWRDKGVFPETLNNYVALLGWSHGARSDVMSMKGLIENASLKFTKGDTVTSPEKLWFLQKKHVTRYIQEEPSVRDSPLYELAVKPMMTILNNEGKPFFDSISTNTAREDFLCSLLRLDAHNYTIPTEYISRNIYLFEAPSNSALVASIPPFMSPTVSTTVDTKFIIEFLQSYKRIPNAEWDLEHLKKWTHFPEPQVKATSSTITADSIHSQLKPVNADWSKQVHRVIRWALMAGMHGPDGAATMQLLGRDECLRRLEAASEILIEQVENQAFGSMDDMPAVSVDAKSSRVSSSPKLPATKKKTSSEDEAFGSLDG